jgi:hypothetical protein
MAIPIENDAHLLRAFRYLAWNPVEAGECKRPQDARWSSYATTVGLRDDYPFVDASRVLDVSDARAGRRSSASVATSKRLAPRSEPSPWPPRVARLAA